MKSPKFILFCLLLSACLHATKDLQEQEYPSLSLRVIMKQQQEEASCSQEEEQSVNEEVMKTTKDLLQIIKDVINSISSEIGFE